MTQNLEAAFEQQLNALGKTLEGTIEEWRNADLESRDDIQARIKGLEDAIAEVKENLQEERRGHLPGVEVAKGSERDAFSLARACRAISLKDFGAAPYEQEVFASMKAKAQSQGTDSAGGYIVPEEAILSVIEKLKAQVVAYELGAMDLAASGVPLVIPRVSASAAGYWVSENATITPSDLTFEQLSLTPKTVAGLVVLSNLLLETGNPAADQIIEEDLAQQIGLAVDAAVLNGGDSGEPSGIMSTGSVGTFTTSLTTTAAPTYGELLSAIDDLATGNALRGSLGWAIHPLALSQIRQVKSENAAAGTASLDVTRVAVSDGAESTILGYPYRVSTQMTAPTASVDTKSMLFGNWSDCLIARWGGMRLLASSTSDEAFSKDQTHIRATCRVDVGLRHVESFTYAD